MKKTLLAFWPQTLKTKIRLALFVTAFIPFVFLLFYVEEMGKVKMLDDTLKIRHGQMSMVKERIGQTLLSLQKEAGFLASLDMMNDMLVNDVDKRIAGLLLHKQQDLAFKTDISAVNSEGKIIASTRQEVQKIFVYNSALKDAVSQHKNYFLAASTLYLFAPIVSTLQNNEALGYLLIAYPLENLKQMTENVQDEVHTLFYFPKSARYIGTLPSKEVLKSVPYNGDYISKKYLILNEHLEGMLSGGFLVYMVQKSLALSFLNQFVTLIWVLLFVGFLVIAFLSWWIGERILKPVHTLTQATKKIISTQDYSTQVALSSEGEIRELTEHFNAMVREVKQTLNVLEKENRLRLLRFTQLITIFNHLIQTKEEKECISLAIEELQRLIPEQHFFFTDQKRNPDDTAHYLTLFVKDFEKSTSRYYGAIVLEGTKTIEDSNEVQFYEAIATMIMLQLDQIGLIERIHSVSEAKSLFISHMSHELRTPLHTILSATQYLIGYEGLTTAQQERVGTIESSAGHLLGMINDILDLAQIEAGKASAEIVLLSSDALSAMIEEVVQMLEVLAEQKSTTIMFENHAPPLQHIQTDQKYFKQILINLLSNAIKFTDKGHIDIVMKMCDERLCICVKDDGIGLSKEESSRLFDAFAQLNKAQKEKGSGLGLVISQKLASLFEGELLVTSEGRGKGVEATLKLFIPLG